MEAYLKEHCTQLPVFLKGPTKKAGHTNDCYCSYCNQYAAHQHVIIGMWNLVQKALFFCILFFFFLLSYIQHYEQNQRQYIKNCTRSIEIRGGANHLFRIQFNALFIRLLVTTLDGIHCFSFTINNEFENTHTAIFLDLEKVGTLQGQ